MAEHESAGDGRSTTIIVANALAAQQWEMHLAAPSIGGGASAWETPPLKPYSAWLDELWLEHADSRGPALTPSQSSALWRAIIAGSPESSDLIAHAGAAEWASGAWQLLHRWQIDPAAERAAIDQVDYRAFLAWCRRYRDWLGGHGFLDRAELEGALSARAGARGRLVVADLEESYPARDALLEALGARGMRIERVGAPTAAGERRAARLADAADELRAAFAWARQRVAENPLARVAIVVPVARRHHELERLAAELEPAPCWTEGRALSVEPAIGAAVDALALATATAPYAIFGRWLRSPFFLAAQEEALARARLDAELRTEMRAQLVFPAAYRCGVRELLAERTPTSARALAAALAAIGGLRRATPTRWAHLWVRFLAELGW
ncbi:MAG: hypothetical protein EHM50_06685, partial [Lysobacterales bacterium]